MGADDRPTVDAGLPAEMTTETHDGLTVVIGRIVRPHGYKGLVIVAPETDFGADRFQPGANLRGVRETERFDLTVATSRAHQGRWIVGFDGVASMDEAEALRDVELRIPDAALTPLPGGQYYLHDLVGCRVTTTAGEELGTVVRVDTGAGPATLAVETPNGEALVPFAESICRQVDVPGRGIVIEPPDGLLDLNQ